MTRPLQRQIDELKIATGSTVTDSTASDIGIATGSTVDKAIDSLAVALNMMKNNNGYLTVTVLNSANGQPIGDVLVNGITDSEGNPVFTNEDGVAAGYISEGSQTVSISNHADITDSSSTVTITKGNFHTLTLNAVVRNFLKITSSKNIYFSSLTESVDISVGGGGGSGGRILRYATEANGGGGGGYSVIQTGLTPTSKTAYNAVVGAGGSAPNYNSSGNDGGSSSFMGITANGGGRGGYISGGSGNGDGGSGGARGGTAPTVGSNGTTYIYTSYTEQSLYGGGGGGGYWTSDSSSTSYVSGGSPSGGAGGSYKGDNSGVNAASNTGGGGGGAAAYRKNDDNTGVGVAGAGGSGVIAIRMHLKSA